MIFEPASRRMYGDRSGRQVHGQHPGGFVRIGRADTRSDIVGERPRHGVVARQHEFLHLDGLGKARLNRDRGHQRPERERHLGTAFHTLAAGGHIGQLHVAFAVVAGLHGGDGGQDDRPAVGPDGRSRVERIEIITFVAAPRHTRIAEVRLALRRAGDADVTAARCGVVWGQMISTRSPLRQ